MNAPSVPKFQYVAVIFLILLSACGDSTHGLSQNGKDSGIISAIKSPMRDSTQVSRLVFNDGGNGCGDMSPVLYTADTTLKNFLVIDIDESVWRGLGTEMRIIDLHSPIVGYRVRLERFTGKGYPRYCDDYHEHLTPEVWNATLGTLAIQKNEKYRVTVRLQNLSFTSPDGKESIITDSVHMDSVNVEGGAG